MRKVFCLTAGGRPEARPYYYIVHYFVGIYSHFENSDPTHKLTFDHYTKTVQFRRAWIK